MSHSHSTLTLLLLGAFHGLNPAMGWLFAVALALQEHKRLAVFRSLIPLAIGHALAIAAAILVAILLGAALPLNYLRWFVAAILIAAGFRFLIRHPHFRWSSMRVNSRDLTLWSFLVATVHGAGLMVVPIFLAASAPTHAARQMSPMPNMPNMPSHSHALAATTTSAALYATLLHTASYLAVAALIAFLVYEKFGVEILRKAWLNLDNIWAAALILTGAATLLL
jgi:hypothetical protein